MRILKVFALVAIASGTLGCQPKESGTANVSSVQAASTYLSDREPAGATPVGEAREQTVDGQEVTLVGRIGGSSKPFIDGLAAFTIVDPKVPHCAAAEGCPTPWDYCCETEAVKSNIATVKIVDATGKPIAQSARDLLKVKELSMVVVKGRAKRDDQGNLTIATNQIFVRPGE